MKRLIGILAACCLLLSGCGASQNTPSGDSGGVDYEIKEKLFVQQMNDIYYNSKDYIGKSIKYEGIFDSTIWNGAMYYSVIRYGPGCCANDGNVGLEVEWDGEYPQNNDWVEVVGVLEEYEESGIPYLRLNLTSLTVLPERGAETVA